MVRGQALKMCNRRIRNDCMASRSKGSDSVCYIDGGGMLESDSNERNMSTDSKEHDYEIGTGARLHSPATQSHPGQSGHSFLISSIFLHAPA